MRLFPLVVASAVLFPSAGFSQDSSPGGTAKIQFEIDKAKADADKPYAGRSEKDLNHEERLAKAQAENDAANKVLESHGTDAKSYTLTRAKMGGDADHEDVKSGKADKDFEKQIKDLKDKEDAAKAKKTEDKPVVVEKGVAAEIQNGVVVEQGIDQTSEDAAGGAGSPVAPRGSRGR